MSKPKSLLNDHQNLDAASLTIEAVESMLEKWQQPQPGERPNVFPRRIVFPNHMPRWAWCVVMTEEEIKEWCASEGVDPPSGEERAYAERVIRAYCEEAGLL